MKSLPESLLKLTVRKDGSLRDVLLRLEEGAAEIVMVVEGERLVGVLTDGDVRRALLAGESLNAPLERFIVADCITVTESASRADVLELMHARRVSQVPVVDSERRLVGVHLVHDMLSTVRRPNSAVIMCGGKGTRLGSLTENTPKPMLRVAGRPILERIVLHLVGFGIRDIALAVHHLASQIEDHFGDGRQFGASIRYLREEQALGTAGALSLLPSPDHPMIVMNGDLVTQFSVDAMLASHERGGQSLTLGVRRYFHTVPFGCVEVADGRVVQIEEKPTLCRIVNAGIYVLDPELLRLIPPNEPFQMPQLIETCLSSGLEVRAFEIFDDWIDIGQREQLKQARGEN